MTYYTSLHSSSTDWVLPGTFLHTSVSKQTVDKNDCTVLVRRGRGELEATSCNISAPRGGRGGTAHVLAHCRGYTKQGAHHKQNRYLVGSILRSWECKLPWGVQDNISTRGRLYAEATVNLETNVTLIQDTIQLKHQNFAEGPTVRSHFPSETNSPQPAKSKLCSRGLPTPATAKSSRATIRTRNLPTLLGLSARQQTASTV